MTEKILKKLFLAYFTIIIGVCFFTFFQNLSWGGRLFFIFIFDIGGFILLSLLFWGGITEVRKKWTTYKKQVRGFIAFLFLILSVVIVFTFIDGVVPLSRGLYFYKKSSSLEAVVGALEIERGTPKTASFHRSLQVLTNEGYKRTLSFSYPEDLIEALKYRFYLLPKTDIVLDVEPIAD